MLLTKQDKVQR